MNFYSKLLLGRLCYNAVAGGFFGLFIPLGEIVYGRTYTECYCMLFRCYSTLSKYDKRVILRSMNDTTRQNKRKANKIILYAFCGFQLIIESKIRFALVSHCIALRLVL